jgi:hypothetical protein
MATDDFSEGIFGAVAAIASEQFQVGFVHFQKPIVADLWNPTRILFLRPRCQSRWQIVSPKRRTQAEPRAQRVQFRGAAMMVDVACE